MPPRQQLICKINMINKINKLLVNKKEITNKMNTS
jgi:hypothetical protein